MASYNSSSRSHHLHVDMDHALDGLGFSYLDGIPFCIDSRFVQAKVDLSRAMALLSKPSPTLDSILEIDLGAIGTLEKQVLSQLEKIDMEKEARQAALDKEISQFEEAEQPKAETPDQEPSEAQEPQAEPTPDPHLEAKSVDMEHQRREAEAAFSQGETAKFTGTRVATNINYSEFEAESDPFERAELQTLDDLGILAVVLQTTADTANSSLPSAQLTYSAAPSMPYPLATYYTSSQSGLPFLPTAATQSPVTMQAASRTGSNAVTVKSSKSYGDLVRAVNEESSPAASRYSQNTGAIDPAVHYISSELRKLSSQTPPPRPSPFRATASSYGHSEELSKVSKNPLDDWIPWPDLDSLHRSHSSTVTKANAAAASEDPLEGLDRQSKDICRRIHDMGFPLARVARVCRALGDDQQQIVHHCLLLDKLLDTGITTDEHLVHQTLLLHSVDEKKTEAHLKLFSKLSELGFPANDIHQALVKTELQYEKALEVLLK